jgi:F0F1-type ATP synthase assembly protein I
MSSADASLFSLGTQMFSEVAAGVLLGLGFDYMLGTKGRWVAVGAISGVVVAMFTLVRLAIKLQPKKRAGSSQPSSRSDQRSDPPSGTPS